MAVGLVTQRTDIHNRKRKRVSWVMAKQLIAAQIVKANNTAGGGLSYNTDTVK